MMLPYSYPGNLRSLVRFLIMDGFEELEPKWLQRVMPADIKELFVDLEFWRIFRGQSWKWRWRLGMIYIHFSGLPPYYVVTAYPISIGNWLFMHFFKIKHVLWQLGDSACSKRLIIQFCHLYCFQRDFFKIWTYFTHVLRISQEFACLPKKLRFIIKNWSRKTIWEFLPLLVAPCSVRAWSNFW